MKILKSLLAFSFIAPFLASTAFAQTNANGFMAPQDLLNTNGVLSNIFLRNSTGSAVTAYGLYIRQLAYVTPGDTCNHATVIYPDAGRTPPIPENITAGAFVMPTAINAGQSAAIGSNYLYNMIYGANYYVNNVITSSPPGCALPGCTWGSDATIYNWCIYLGALAPVNVSSDYTSTVPPAANVASSTGLYNYNLISNSGYVYLGPISCNDQTLTCTVASQQTQAF